MTKSSSINYDEAVVFAQRILEDDLKLKEYLPASMLSEGGLRANLLTISGYRRVKDDPSKIIAASRRDPDKFEELQRGIVKHLRAGNELPPEIQDWIADFIEGKIMDPPKRDGAKGALGRHMYVYLIVECLNAKGLYRFRNPEPTHDQKRVERSACDAVAEALRNLDLSPETYRGVKDVYAKVSRILREGGTFEY